MRYIQKIRFLFLGVATTMVATLSAAPSLPSAGKVLEFTYGSQPTESVSKREVTFDEESKTYQVDCDSLAGRKAKYSIVVTYKVEKLDSISAVELVRFYDNRYYERGFFSVNHVGKLAINGCSSPESDKSRRLSFEAGMADGQEFTMVQTVDMETREAHIVANGHDYAYYLLPLSDNAKVAPNQVRIYKSKWICPVKVTIYNRVLSDKEMVSVMGSDLEKHDSSEMDRDNTSFSFLGVIDLLIIIVVAYVFFRVRKSKLEPMTADDIARASKGDLSKDQALQEALHYLEEANAPWNWEPLTDQEEYGCSYPQSVKELRQSREALQKAIATGCTDQDVVEGINMQILLHNRALGLTFNGWFPFVLIAFIAIIAMPIIKGDFWHMVLSWQYLGYWAGLVAYVVASMCFRAVAQRGKPVEELETLKEKVANISGSALAGGMAVAGAAAAGLGFLSNSFNWALEHSVTHYRVYRNGTHIGNTSEMNPTGFVYFFIVIGALLVLLYIAWAIVMFILQFAAIYKFVRNYLIRR